MDNLTKMDENLFDSYCKNCKSLSDCIDKGICCSEVGKAYKERKMINEI